MKNLFKYVTLGLSLIGCTSTSVKFNDGFPDSWWVEIPKDQLAWWEIPPQAADRAKGEVILSKRTELGQFSNFPKFPFTLDRVKYESLEGFWQSLKYPEGPNDERLKDKSIKWELTREQVRNLSAFEAKKAGDAASENMKKLNIKWVSYKGKKIDYVGGDNKAHYDLIVRATRAKLEAHPELLALLKSTRNLKLLPDHEQKADAPASYRYYDIYMKIRDEVK